MFDWGCSAREMRGENWGVVVQGGNIVRVLS